MYLEVYTVREEAFEGVRGANEKEKERRETCIECY
jgi:hypothetical protein